MILCCGEALIDMIPKPTAEPGPDGFVPHVGGAVMNTAVALGRLGDPVGLITGLSQDPFGARLSAALQASNVDTSAAVRSARATTLAFVHLVEGQATYSFYDENSATRMIDSADLTPPETAPEAGFFGGISLCNLPAADAFAGFAETLARDSVIMLDPNIRPGFITDEAGYRARLLRMMAVADIVKLSDEDMDWLWPDDSNPAQTAAAMCNPALMLFTHGSKGATAHLPSGVEVTVAAPRVTPVDTVGAGDSFNAAVLSRLRALGLLGKSAIPALDEDQLRDVLGFATRVAAVTVTRSGANPPWASEMEDLTL